MYWGNAHSILVGKTERDIVKDYAKMGGQYWEDLKGVIGRGLTLITVK